MSGVPAHFRHLDKSRNLAMSFRYLNLSTLARCKCIPGAFREALCQRKKCTNVISRWKTGTLSTLSGKDARKNMSPTPYSSVKFFFLEPFGRGGGAYSTSYNSERATQNKHGGSAAPPFKRWEIALLIPPPPFWTSVPASHKISNEHHLDQNVGETPSRGRARERCPLFEICFT